MWGTSDGALVHGRSRTSALRDRMHKCDYTQKCSTVCNLLLEEASNDVSSAASFVVSTARRSSPG